MNKKTVLSTLARNGIQASLVITNFIGEINTTVIVITKFNCILVIDRNQNLAETETNLNFGLSSLIPKPKPTGQMLPKSKPKPKNFGTIKICYIISTKSRNPKFLGNVRDQCQKWVGSKRAFGLLSQYLFTQRIQPIRSVNYSEINKYFLRL